MDDIVELRIYIVSTYIHTDGSTISAALRAAVKPDRPPTSNCIGGVALANHGFLIASHRGDRGCLSAYTRLWIRYARCYNHIRVP